MQSYAASLEAGVTPDDARNQSIDYVRYVMQDEEGRPLCNDHITRLYLDCWQNCFANSKHMSFISPPGIGKTTLALAALTEAIGRNPKLRTVVVTADLQDTINAVTLARQIVMTQQFRDVFPDSKPDIARSTDARGWRMSSWFMQAAGMRRDPTMAAVAIDPKREAMRVDVGLFDDIITEKTCEGTIEQTYDKRFWKTWVEGRFRPNGRMIYHQNIRRLKDLAHRLREDRRFCSLWLGLNPDFESMFLHVWNPPPYFPVLRDPEKYRAEAEPPPSEHPEPHLRFRLPLPERIGWEPETLRAMNKDALKQLYFFQPVKAEDLVLRDWGMRTVFNGTAAQMAGIQVDEYGWPVMSDLDRMRYGIAAGLDLSSTKRPGTCLWVALVDAQGTMLPLFLTKGNYTLGQISEIMGRLWDNGVHFQCTFVEDVGVQDMILQSLKDPGKDGKLPPWTASLKGFTTGKTNKRIAWNWNLGGPSMNRDFEVGKILWPKYEAKYPRPDENRRPTGHEKFWATFELLAETVTLQGIMDDPPDEFMALWFCREACRKVGPYSGAKKASTAGLTNAAQRKKENKTLKDY